MSLGDEKNETQFQNLNDFEKPEFPQINQMFIPMKKYDSPYELIMTKAKFLKKELYKQTINK